MRALAPLSCRGHPFQVQPDADALHAAGLRPHGFQLSSDAPATWSGPSLKALTLRPKELGLALARNLCDVAVIALEGPYLLIAVGRAANDAGYLTAPRTEDRFNVVNRRKMELSLGRPR